MFEISDKEDERLKAMDFLEYLKEMHGRLERISHRSKSNSAYSECYTLANHIKYRIVKEYKLTWEDFDNKIGKNLRASADILNLYSTGESDKRKSARIKEFVDEYTYDLSNFIRARERRKENPSSPIDENEV